MNNPIKYYDPTGHIVTKWDKKNLSKKDQDKIDRYTKNWEKYDKELDKLDPGSKKFRLKKKMRDTQHALAESIRNKHRNESEEGRDDGYTRDKKTKKVISRRKDTDSIPTDNTNFIVPEEIGQDDIYYLSPYQELDYIEKTAIKRVEKLIEKEILFESYFWPIEYCINDYTMGQIYENYYKQEKERTEYIDSIPNVIDISKSVYVGYEQAAQTGPNYPIIKGLEIVGHGIADYFTPSPAPSTSDIVNTELVTDPMVRKAKEKMDEINNSPYKLLVDSSFARKNFIKELDELINQINNYDYSLFGENETKYKETMINYIDNIININVNYKESKKNVEFLIKQIDEW